MTKKKKGGDIWLDFSYFSQYFLEVLKCLYIVSFWCHLKVFKHKPSYRPKTGAFQLPNFPSTTPTTTMQERGGKVGRVASKLVKYFTECCFEKHFTSLTIFYKQTNIQWRGKLFSIIKNWVKLIKTLLRKMMIL